MIISKITTCALLGVPMVLVACAVPKAVVVAPIPVVKKDDKKEPEPIASEAELPNLPTMPDDGIRMPDMLGLPTDGEYRATTPVAPKTDPGAGSVFVRPPTDPPSRVKPKPTE